MVMLADQDVMESQDLKETKEQLDNQD